MDTRGGLVKLANVALLFVGGKLGPLAFFFSCTQVSSSSLNLSSGSPSHSKPTVERTDIMIGTRNTSSPEPDWNTNGTLTGPR